MTDDPLDPTWCRCDTDCGQTYCASIPRWVIPDRFIEDDEPLEKIEATFDRGVKGLTQRPCCDFHGDWCAPPLEPCCDACPLAPVDDEKGWPRP